MEQRRRGLLGVVLLSLCWVYATGASVYVVGSVVGQPAYWSRVPSSIRVLSGLLGVLILVLDFAWLILFFRRAKDKEWSPYLISKTKDGTARISLKAVQESLLRRAREMEEVIGAKVAVRRSSAATVRVDVSYTTREGESAISVSESLRGALRERFFELVHPEEGFEVEFQVRIEGFVPAVERAPENRPDREKGKEPFTGPRYPID